MKVLFLDFDGVLNSSRTCAAFDGYPFNLKGDLPQFDHVAIALIRKVCEQTGCKVVISSTWRRGTSLQEIKDVMDLPVIDRTPMGREHGLPLSAERGHEIANWLERNPHVVQYAIVDDECFDIHQRGRLVQTSQEDGLRWEDYEKLLELLK